MSTKDKIKKTKEEQRKMTNAKTVGTVTHTHTQYIYKINKKGNKEKQRDVNFVLI